MDRRASRQQHMLTVAHLEATAQASYEALLQSKRPHSRGAQPQRLVLAYSPPKLEGPLHPFSPVRSKRATTAPGIANRPTQMHSLSGSTSAFALHRMHRAGFTLDAAPQVPMMRPSTSPAQTHSLCGSASAFALRPSTSVGVLSLPPQRSVGHASMGHAASVGHASVGSVVVSTGRAQESRANSAGKLSSSSYSSPTRRDGSGGSCRREAAAPPPLSVRHGSVATRTDSRESVPTTSRDSRESVPTTRRDSRSSSRSSCASSARRDSNEIRDSYEIRERWDTCGSSSTSPPLSPPRSPSR